MSIKRSKLTVDVTKLVQLIGHRAGEQTDDEIIGRIQQVIERVEADAGSSRQEKKELVHQVMQQMNQKAQDLLGQQKNSSVASS